MSQGTNAAPSVIVLLGSLALLSCSSIEFEQTNERGSRIESEEAKIPDAYLGLWASPKDACFVTRDYGMQMSIGKQTIGEMPVRRVWGYSDYTDIIVELDAKEEDSDVRPNLFLQISNNGQKIRARQTGDSKYRILHRCKSTAGSTLSNSSFEIG